LQQDLYDLEEAEEASPEGRDRRRDTRRPHEKKKRRDRTRAPMRPGKAPEWFACVHCGQPIAAEAFGTQHRNHCPYCLWSRHVDETPGDRASECRSAMEPIAVWARPGGDWAIIHRCRGCGDLKSNRIAGDDNELLLVALATRALAQPPFPLNRLAALGERGGGGGTAVA
jgi:hypothetical protein